MKNFSKNALFLITFGASLSLVLQLGIAQAQLKTPRTSPAASVSQTIGITDITIKYHRPGVKGRELWGTRLVPFDGKPFPWRAGANDNTTISFSHDVTVEGKEVPAGTYGVHMIPSKGDWIIALSSNHTSWGSFNYKQEEDVARVTVTPQEADHKEWMQFGFDDLTNSSAVAYLHWEKLRVPFRIEVDVHEIVLANMRNELRHLAGFRWQGPYEAANYCLRNNINHEEALGWIDRSIGRDENFDNLSVKARLLAQVGQTQESNQAIERGVEIANVNQLNGYGRWLLRQENADEAVRVLKINVKRNPDAWSAYNTLAQAYEQQGKTKDAIKNYKKAHGKAPDDRKAGIEGKIKGLEATD